MSTVSSIDPTRCGSGGLRPDTRALAQRLAAQSLDRSTARRHWACAASASAAGLVGLNSTSSTQFAVISSRDDHTPSARPAR